MFRVRTSLATKCQLLFGAAVLLIVGAAVAVLWVRVDLLVLEAQRERAAAVVDSFLIDRDAIPPGMRWIDGKDFVNASNDDPFLHESLNQQLLRPGGPRDVIRLDRLPGGGGVFRYARLVRDAKGEIDGVARIDAGMDWATRQALVNRAYTAVAALAAIALAIATFWLVITRLILSPVRVLRDTAAKAAEGDLNIRSVVHTGDEFEQLSEAFNSMLTNLKASQDKLRDLNRQLDLKLGELSESNITLNEANRMKGEFLANVSHELRTPLNSIIGFAEVLIDSLGEGASSVNPAEDEKRKRYLQNIMKSGRSLLTMITELLDLAKIEAGRVELNPESLSVSDVCEALLNLIQPQADQKKITLKLAVPRRVGTIRTDAGKFQQILFNFLSNAVKFTPEGGSVELGAEATEPRSPGEREWVSIWVADSGPGIPLRDQARVFEKFQQLDPGHTREHGGAGLGLAISLEFARLLQGRIELESEPGKGSKFTLVIPREIVTESADALMPRHA